MSGQFTHHTHTTGVLCQASLLTTHTPLGSCVRPRCFHTHHWCLTSGQPASHHTTGVSCYTNMLTCFRLTHNISQTPHTDISQMDITHHISQTDTMFNISQKDTAYHISQTDATHQSDRRHTSHGSGRHHTSHQPDTTYHMGQTSYQTDTTYDISQTYQ